MGLFRWFIDLFVKPKWDLPKDTCEDKIRELNKTIQNMDFDYGNLLEKNKKIYTELEVLKQEEDPLEDYWNNKRPKKENLVYPGRPLFQSVTKCYIDPRIFFTNDLTQMPKMTGTNDEKAIKALDFVKNNVTYTSDKNPSEFWQFAFETKQRKQGDCEDGAIYIANILIASGVPDWRIRLNAGDVKGGGHAYVTYLAEKDDQWYILDWCYWYEESKNLRRTFKEAEKYFGIWFSWNTKFIFPNDELDRETLKAKGIRI